MPANSEQFNEQQRLQTINEFYLRKAEPDEQLESLLSAIAELLNIPIALVSVIDQFEQFFKANVGLLCQSTRREDAFCNQVVQNNQLLIVEDALTHPLFAVNPLVTGEPHIRFYAGVPFSFALANPDVLLPACFLIYSFMGTTGSFLAYAAISAKRGVTTDRDGKKSFFYSVGLMEGTETIIFFILFCLFPQNFAALAWIFGILCWFTTVIRVITGTIEFRRRY